MTPDDLLRIAFLGLHPEHVDRLLEGGSPMEELYSGKGRRRLMPAAECRALVDRWGGAFDVVGEGVWGERFAHVEDRPRWLFRSGAIVEGPLVAIVGTRRCTEYGRRFAFAAAQACAEAGWGVVSGLARGIDVAAHRGALAGSGRTLAVLGSGPDVSYPRGHDRVRREIVESGGALLSEYPPGCDPLPWRFPPRNRIISGLSAAVVVVESGDRGGSLSTAARALAQARPVFAVPGDIDREASVGCNRLIRDGAIPVLGPEDLVEALQLVGH